MDTKENDLIQRLNLIKPKLLSPAFLKNEGLGNEIAFYIFDYQPEFELLVRQHLVILLNALQAESKGTRFLHINLFSLVLEYLKHRGCYEQALELEKTGGTQDLLAAFEDLLSPENVCDFFVSQHSTESFDVLLVSGVGSCWPFLRAHTILNNLQNYVANKPTVFFYPGQYTGQDLQPFGLAAKKSNYYRAFPLIEQRTVP